jgi:hypothetical protein
MLRISDRAYRTFALGRLNPGVYLQHCTPPSELLSSECMQMRGGFPSIPVDLPRERQNYDTCLVALAHETLIKHLVNGGANCCNEPDNSRVYRTSELRTCSRRRSAQHHHLREGFTMSKPTRETQETIKAELQMGERERIVVELRSVIQEI